jgi:AraC-like DNA-binding protein
LSSAINRATGLNVSQFVNNFRVADACRLMAESNRSTTAIMLEAGFSTKSNFNREFRRVTGQSPSEWRAAGSAQAVPRKNGLDLSGSRQQLGNVQR